MAFPVVIPIRKCFYYTMVLLKLVPADNNNFPVNQLEDITGNAHRLKNCNTKYQTRLLLESDFLTDINLI